MKADSSESSLNILLVHVWYWPHVGGGDQHVEQLGRELVRKGHKVSVWCADVPAHEQQVFNRGGVDVVRLTPTRVLNGVDPVVSTKHLDISIFDLVHLHDTLPWLVRQVSKRAKRAGIPTVTTYHNDYIKYGLGANLVKRLRWSLQGKRTLHCSAARIVLTTYFEQLLRRKGVRGDIDIIPTGFAASDEDAVRPVGLLGRDESRALLVFIGRLSEQKGLDVLLDAWDILAAESAPGFDLAIAGEGELESWLEQRHSTTNSAGDIRVLGLVTDAEKRWLLENANGMLIPSRFEGLPAVLLESMHAAAPVVMADVNGLGGFVESKGAGLGFASGDAAGLARSISQLLSVDEQQRAAWGESGALASRDFLWPAVTARILSVYQRVLNHD